VPDEVAHTEDTRRVEPAAASSDSRPGSDGDADSREQTTAPRERPVEPDEDERWRDVPRRIDRFTVLEKLGSGGGGVVYAAYDPRLDRQVALKLLKPGGGTANDVEDAKARFIREGKAMARLSHPNVLTVYDVGTHHDQVYLVLELVAEGGPLHRHLQQHRPAWREVLSLYRAAGRGLAAAHLVGLVHRDFKPSNVLVGNDGRVRVMDFGLARSAQGKEAGQSSTPATWDTSNPDVFVTAPGEALGTPAYMAPEQFRGGAIDAKADQFSFCVALYQGLYDQRPFKWTNAKELEAAVLSGEVRPPPADSLVPAWVRRAVLRGLEQDPSARWPSMRDLLAALERDPKRRWMRVGLIAASLVAALGVGTLYSSADADAPVCDGGLDRFTGVWDEARKQQLAAAFAAVDSEFGAESWGRVEARLDAYLDDWSGRHRETCMATELAGDQSREVMHFKMFCLERHALEVDGFLKALDAADTDTVRHAVQGALALSPLDRCPRGAFEAQLELAPDDETMQWLTRLRGTMADARGLQAAGKYDAGVALAHEVVREAKDLGHKAFEAEALLRLGALLHYAGKYDESATTLVEATWAAEESRMDAVAAEAKTLVTHVVSRHLADYEQGELWAGQAQSAIRRIQPPDEALEARLLVYQGTLKSDQGDYEGGIRDLERALEIRRRVLGQQDVEVGYVHHELGLTQMELGNLDEARRHFLRAFEINEAVLGDEHPELAPTLNDLGQSELARGEHVNAQKHFERAIELYESMTKATYPATGEVYGNLGAALAAQNKYRRAKKAYRRALTLIEQAHGADHPLEAEVRMSLAETLVSMNDEAGAREHATAALRICRAKFGDEHPRVAKAQAFLAALGNPTGSDASAAAGQRK
jgi:tetratricopeptide (TPR) repeat protein